MKKIVLTSICAIFLTVSVTQSFAQENDLNEEKKYSLALGLGYFNPILSEKGIAFSNATYDPQLGAGASFSASFDYALSEKFAVGVGFNGSYASAEFIRDAVVNDSQVDGYLEAGALENIYILANLTYSKPGDGIQPYAKLGLGYFIVEVELGDVPLELTDNVEVEMFPDFKSSGFGVLPELGVRYNALSLSVAYSLPFDDSEGETVDEGFQSAGSISSQGLQVNVTYRISLF